MFSNKSVRIEYKERIELFSLGRIILLLGQYVTWSVFLDAITLDRDFGKFELSISFASNPKRMNSTIHAIPKNPKDLELRSLAFTHPNQIFNLNDVVGCVSWWNRWHLKIGIYDLRLICRAAMCIQIRYNNCLQLFVSATWYEVNDFLKEVTSIRDSSNPKSDNWSNEWLFHTLTSWTVKLMTRWLLRLSTFTSKLIIWPGVYPPTGVRTTIFKGPDEQQHSKQQYKNVRSFLAVAGPFHFQNITKSHWSVLSNWLNQNKLPSARGTHSNRRP